ncbi:cyclophilin-like protein [Pholiota molesta]|nr:cyclophilin-like protein [Pholiota molesta]
MALPTNGKVILDTTVGEIEIDLWPKEAPKATRNFLALSMEEHYDGVIFHRVVPGFLVQTGDRTGLGGGGESFYGGACIVAMANDGTKNSNDSQFFYYPRADELHGNHTVFGRCIIGDTVYSTCPSSLSNTRSSNRSVRIVDNPSDDIVPRITAAEKRAQQRAR